jgi:UDP-N-acetylmuramate-alanine ligase
MRLKYGINVAGMHGKTTSMIASRADPETGCNPAATLL